MRIYQLRRAVGNNNLLDEHQEEIRSLLKGDYHTSDLEKLKGYDLYSFRISKKARLLFTVQTINGHRCLLVLEYLPNHEYEKSRFLKSGFLKQYLEKELATIAEDAPMLEPLAKKIFSQETYEPCGIIDVYQRQMIKLDLNQEKALQVALPALCSGPAGGGKSITALMRLYQQQTQLSLGEELAHLPSLYITQSTALARAMEASFHELPHDERERPVLFKTFTELLQELELVSKMVGREEFISWYQKRVKHEQKTTKFREDSHPNMVDADTAYQECYIASGYSKEDYEKLSTEQSSLDKDKRGGLYLTYEAYLKYLKESNLVDPAFHIWSTHSLYSMIVVDEAQDFSNQQLRTLMTLAKDKRILYFVDSHQQLNEEKSKRPFLRQQCGITNHVLLYKMYRCPLNVVAVANTINSLKVRCVGGIADREEFIKTQSAQETERLGHVVLFDKESIQKSSWLMQQIKGPHCAIITLKEHIEEARSLFKDSLLIMTPEQAKGLEYPVVITYKLYRPDFLKKVQKKLAKLGDAPEPTHRPKGDAECGFTLDFNTIYTSYTRTIGVLVICEPDARDDHPIIQSIKTLITKEPLPDKDLVAEIKDSWDDEILRQIQAGNNDLARLIFTGKLGGKSDEFEQFAQSKIQLKKNASPNTTALLVKEDATSEKRDVKPLNDLLKQPPASPSAKKDTKIKSVKQPLPPKEPSQAAKIIGNLLQKDLKEVTDQYLKTTLSLLNKLQIKNSSEEIKPLKNYLTKNESVFHAFVRVVASNYDMTPWITSLGFEKNQTLKNILKYMKSYGAIYRDSGSQVAHFAAGKGDNDMLMTLKTFGVDLNIPEKDGFTPAHFAVQKGHDAVLCTLKSLGADLDQTSNNGHTPAHVAAQQGHDAVLRTLKSLGADLDQTANDGYTPAHLAAQQGHDAVLRTLKSLGADLNKPDNDGFTPAHLAALKNNEATLRTLKSLGADLNKPNNNGFTPAHVAVQQGHDAVLRTLKSLGADLDQTSNNGYTPAHVAAQQGHDAVLRTLKSLGVDLNSQQHNDLTPAHIAAQQGHNATLRTLHSLGADLNKPNNDGFTPAHYAVLHGRESMLDFLIDYGVNLDVQIKITKKSLLNFAEEASDASKKIETYFSRNNILDNETVLPLSLLDFACIMDHSKINKLLSKKRTLDKYNEVSGTPKPTSSAPILTTPKSVSTLPVFFANRGEVTEKVQPTINVKSFVP
ncbi:ankyrin repeat domain-containing protein [Legionella sp. km772]|uniref:ankyrin repeat domain-containing protein n=1 Tax=Legionella sp. km772 TaxID=2498111 RepID=UPI000F8E2FEC|nr:ankyrin repeat domain-containing protein [Legionella sp. km772]RUR06055.1 hypothetical protein ELY15_13605 [Legionella sp. km772]